VRSQRLAPVEATPAWVRVSDRHWLRDQEDVLAVSDRPRGRREKGRSRARSWLSRPAAGRVGTTVGHEISAERDQLASTAADRESEAPADPQPLVSEGVRRLDEVLGLHQCRGTTLRRIVVTLWTTPATASSLVRAASAS
jgi:hypothetical protein